ncbi:MAG TPA: glycosyltransferase family 61 protein, partial [Methylibium sp.]|nr:glycosyltransferase family 61 protein [Methylibium sp.]
YKQDPNAAQGDLRFVARKVAARTAGDEDERRDRFALAQALYQVPDLKDEAYRLYAAADPALPEQHDLGVGWVRLHDWCKKAGLAMQRDENHGRVGHRPTLAELSRVAVLPAFQWMPLLDEQGAAIAGFQMRRLVYRAKDSDSPLLLHRSPDRAVLRLPRELPVHPGPALLLGGIAQYYHQTVEHLGTLAIAEALGLPPDMPLVVNHDVAPFQLEQFEMLGIPEDRLIRVAPDAPLRFERLWVASRPTHGGHWIDPLVPAWFRRRLGLPDRPGRRKLYLSRAGTDRRRVANEPALIDRLAARGFEVVRPETLSVREQVALFAEASHIVAPTGAALTNMIYAPTGSQVVAIYHRAFVAMDGALYFDALAAACGHRFASVLADAVVGHASGRTIDADIEVDIAAVEAALA